MSRLRRRDLRALILCPTVAALAACGSSSSPSASPPATASAACEQLYAASAKRYVRCSGGALADWSTYLELTDKCAAYDQHVADKQVEYRPASFAGCLAEYDQPCEQTLSSCLYEVLHGLVPDGQHCTDDEVCDVASGCINLSGTACAAECMHGGAENQPCGLYCGGATPCYDYPFCSPGLTCVNNVCVSGGATGAACGGSQQLTCAWPAFCSADPSVSGSAGLCTMLAAGGTCRSDAECPANQFCLSSTCTPRLALGASCAAAPTGCVPWTTCDASTAVCVAAGRIGQPCGTPYPSSPDFHTCLVGVCDSTTTCVNAPTAGQSCATLSCAPGNDCDAATGTCTMCGP